MAAFSIARAGITQRDYETQQILLFFAFSFFFRSADYFRLDALFSRGCSSFRSDGFYLGYLMGHDDYRFFRIPHDFNLIAQV